MKTISKNNVSVIKDKYVSRKVYDKAIFWIWILLGYSVIATYYLFKYKGL